MTKTICNIESKLDMLEDFFKDKRIAKWVTFLIVIILLILALRFNNAIVINVLFVALVFVTSVGLKWRHSLKSNLMACVFYNFVAAILLADSHRVAGFIIYGVLWIVCALFADYRVSLLTNEIISLASATIFSIGLFVSQMLYNDVVVDVSADNKIFFDEIYSESTKIFAIFLPYIALSAVSIIVIKLKIYYKENMEKEEKLTENG